MRIITVSREFGSGGRELGKRIADNMGIAYFDREIITAVAEGSQMDENYVEAVLDRGMFRDIPVTFGHSISSMSGFNHATQKIISEQHRIINEIAEHGDCVIVGRNADIFLRDKDPLKLFVYADMDAKVERCRQRAPEGEQLSDKELRRMIKRIDKARARTHAFFTDIPWGDKGGYHMCINTTGLNIKSLAKILSDYSEHWFEK